MTASGVTDLVRRCQGGDLTVPRHRRDSHYYICSCLLPTKESLISALCSRQGVDGGLKARLIACLTVITLTTNLPKKHVRVSNQVRPSAHRLRRYHYGRRAERGRKISCLLPEQRLPDLRNVVERPKQHDPYHPQTHHQCYARCPYQHANRSRGVGQLATDPRVLYHREKSGPGDFLHPGCWLAQRRAFGRCS